MSRQVLLGCWAAIAVGVVACEVAARATGGRVRRLVGLMATLTRRDRVLAAAFVGWMWVGWHFFAR
ncbi:MAG: hypothetical protein ACYCU7_10705 [Acidimicrobiales bacterium]